MATARLDAPLTSGTQNLSGVSVDAVIVNYRTPVLAAAAVSALLASDFPADQLRVWIVDNDSADGSAEQLRARFPEIPVLSAPKNLGFAGGNNLALREILTRVLPGADRERAFVLLLNSDAVVEPDALAGSVRFLLEHPQAGVVGPRLLLPNGRLDLACRRGFPTPINSLWKVTGIARLFPDNPRFTGYNLTHLPEDETAEVDSVVAACMLVRVSAIDAAGLLDERFFMYGEDLDWSYRIKERGWRVYYYPEVIVHHIKGATTRRQSWRMLYEFYRAMWLFHHKHYAERSLFLLNWLVLAGIVARGALALTRNAMRPRARRRVG